MHAPGPWGAPGHDPLQKFSSIKDLFNYVIDAQIYWGRINQSDVCILAHLVLAYSILPPPTGVDYSGVIAGRVRSPEMKNFSYRKIQRILKGLFDNITLRHTIQYVLDRLIKILLNKWKFFTIPLTLS